MKPFLWQTDFFKSFKTSYLIPDYKASLLAKRQIGKSFSCILAVLYAACRTDWGSFGWFSPSHRQARKAFKDLQTLYNQYNLHCTLKFNESLLIVTVEETHANIEFQSLGSEDSLRGGTYNGVIIDEAAYIPDYRIMLTFPFLERRHGFLILASTPFHRSGMFYSFTEDPSVDHFDWTKYDLSEVITDEVIEFYRRTLTPAFFKTDVLGEFLDEGESLLFGNISEQIKQIPYSGQDLVCGIDYSISQNDYCSWSLFFRDSSNNICELASARFRVSDASDTVSRYLSDLSPYLSNIKIIMSETNSCGGAFESYLKKALREKGCYQLANNVVSDWWNSKTKGESIALATTLFNTRQLFIHTSDLVSEMNNYSQIITSSGKISYGNAHQGDRDYHDDIACAAFHAISGIKELSSRGTYVFV